MTITRTTKKQSIYGELYGEGTGIKTADSITLTAGTADGGSVADTTTVNQVYYHVGELSATPGFDIRFHFTLAHNPGKLTIVGRYDGNIGHDVVVEAWNYTLSQWDSFTGSASDIPHTNDTDIEYTFDYADLAGVASDYLSGTDSLVRIYHTSAGNAAHDMYVDLICINEAQFVIATAGTFQALDGFTEGSGRGIILDGANGTMTTVVPGMYLALLSVSFGGSDNASFEGHFFVDGVKQLNVGSARKLGSSGDIGSTPMNGLLDLIGGQVVTLRATSKITGDYFSLENINWTLIKL